MADVLQGYKEIPEEDRKKADVFFAQGAKVAGTGNYEYAIEMYLQGLMIDPDAKEAHQALREISMKRKASGGKDLPFMKKLDLKRPGKDDADNMLRAERLLSYDPGNTDNMLRLIKSAHKAGFYDTVLWIGPILQKANSDNGKHEDVNKYLALRDIYVDLKLWRQATDACQRALNMRPDDMELQRIVKDLGAMDIIKEGNYLEGDSFRGSIKNMEAQRKLIEADMDIRDADVLARQVKDADAEFQAAPEDASKLSRLVDALVRSETMENENRAIELLQQWYEKTGQFRFRLTMGKIKINQLRRQDRAELSRLRQASKAAQASQDPKDLADYNALVAQYKQFQKEKNQEELKEFQLFSENYPTDMTFRYEWGVRLFALDRHNEAIAMFQQARADPKLRVDASTYLGRAFMACGFLEEAVDTLKVTIDEYELRGDERSKALFYWYGNALELKGDAVTALKTYSQLVQWDFNYRDVQARIKRLRHNPGPLRPNETTDLRTYPLLPKLSGDDTPALQTSHLPATTPGEFLGGQQTMKFNLIDRIESLTENRIVAVKQVSLAEEYLADHFPTFPVLPGVMMLEAATQAAGWLLHVQRNFACSIAVLKEARNVKYGQFVVPGDQLRIEAELLKSTEAGATFKITGTVGQKQSIAARIEIAYFNLASRDPAMAAVDARLQEHTRARWNLLKQVSPSLSL